MHSNLKLRTTFTPTGTVKNYTRPKKKKTSRIIQKKMHDLRIKKKSQKNVSMLTSLASEERKKKKVTPQPLSKRKTYLLGIWNFCTTATWKNIPLKKTRPFKKIASFLTKEKKIKRPLFFRFYSQPPAATTISKVSFEVCSIPQWEMHILRVELTLLSAIHFRTNYAGPRVIFSNTNPCAAVCKNDKKKYYWYLLWIMSVGNLTAKSPHFRRKLS